MKVYKYFVETVDIYGDKATHSNVYPLKYDVCLRKMNKCISDVELFTRGESKVVSYRIEEV